MSGLTNLDKQNLSAVAGDAAWKQFVRMTSSNPSDITRRVMLALYPEIEAIVTRTVNEALTKAADAIAEFDPSDKYHAEDYQEPGYYRALSRAESLLRGEIRTWHDSPPSPRTN